MKNFALVFAIIGLLLANVATAGVREDIAAGQNLFDHGCTSCHDDTGYMVKGDGPALFGVVGRRVGSVAGYTYSPALQAANRNGDIWTESRLQAFLVAPGHMYPGTTMPWNFSEAKDRKAMVAYLKSLKPTKPGH